MWRSWIGACLAIGGLAASCGEASRTPECDVGTVAKDGECLAVASFCGDGTRFDGSSCVADSQLACGEGTMLVAGLCQPSKSVSCGAGTHLAGNECVPNDSSGSAGGAGGVGGADDAFGARSSGGDSGANGGAHAGELAGFGGLDQGTDLQCGSGTTRVGNVCVADGGVSCGQGTKLSAGVCLPVDASVRCGSGTVLTNGECVPADQLTCGSGTQRAGNECVPAADVQCGPGTMQVGTECVPAASVCGDGTKWQRDRCVPVEVKCGLGTRLQGNECVVSSVTPEPTSSTFQFSIAEKGRTGIIYFLDSTGRAVHRYDVSTKKFLSPFATPSAAASTMSVSALADSIYVGSPGGRIDTLQAADGKSSFFAAAPETPIWIEVAGSYLYVIDASGAWETHSTFSRATGERLSFADWRNASYGAFFAPQTSKIFTFRDGTSPNDISFETIDQATGALSQDVESPYHGDYSFAHPIRVSPDESLVFVASGVSFKTSDLTYAGSMGLSYTDLGFHSERLYLLHATANNSELLVLDERYAIVDSVELTGAPLRLFVHEDTLVVFTRQESAIAVWQQAL